MMAGVYLTCAMFVFVVLGAVCPPGGLQHLEVPEVHQGGDRHYDRDVIVGSGAAQADGEA